MFSSIVYLGALVGLVFGAGYAGARVARRKAPRAEARISPPWTAYERARELENVGFLSGAAGGALVLSFVLVLWWAGDIKIHLNI
ncbi:hypothetical protein SAMN05443247_10510 [Bradyrhizobium erythrophlei]|nr:hypothetical protein SAMN05443247_10510 [Bradyrhizobium erythrophlei]